VTHVDTIDYEDGETCERAIEICKRAYLCGFFGLPFIWGAYAYYFHPELASRRNKRVDWYLQRMRVGFFVWFAAMSAWALFWVLLGREVFGDRVFEDFAVGTESLFD